MTKFTEDLVDVLPKNDREEVRVTVSEYGGHRLLNLRVFAGNQRVSRVATAKGLSLRVSQIRALINVLERAEAVCADRGYLRPPVEVSPRRWWDN